MTLTAESVTKSYRSPWGTVIALDGVSLELGSGSRLGLVGRSGAGKSTLAQILALLLEPDGGTVTVDGTLVRAWGLRSSRALRHRVQLLWQSPRLSVDPRLRIGEAILEPLAASGMLPGRKGEREKLLGHSAESAGLTGDLLERYPHEVSEGQLQRACLARALILKPAYLVCDEPGAMLDVSTQAALLEAIHTEQEKRGLGVLLITHDRILAEHWCDGLIELKKPEGHPGNV